MYEELIKELRSHNGWALNETLDAAADAIEELGRMLCNWCGVCPEERRDLWNCEIAFPNAQVTEVWIEPPKEETE